MMTLEVLKYPIGRYEPDKTPSEEKLEQWIYAISSFPNQIRTLTADLGMTELNWRYRPQGWTVKQVVHHCADSHMNSILRFKLALTEERPTIRPYYEDRWALLEDGNLNDLSSSLRLIEAIHAKWVILLRHLSPDQLQREYVHPEHGTSFNLAETIGNYAWHGQHHLAHIQNALKYRGEFQNISF